MENKTVLEPLFAAHAAAEDSGQTRLAPDRIFGALSNQRRPRQALGQLDTDHAHHLHTLAHGVYFRMSNYALHVSL